MIIVDKLSNLGAWVYENREDLIPIMILFAGLDLFCFIWTNW